MMKQYLLVAVALLAVVGCQRRPFNGGDPAGEACVVRFQAETRADVEPASKATIRVDRLIPGSTVRVIAYQRQSTTQANPDLTKDVWKATSTYKVQNDFTLTPCHVNDDGTVNTAVGTAAKGMELHNGTYDFYAYSPARKLESDNQSVKGLGHYEDFMGAYSWSQTISRSSSTVALAFEHECAKVTFTVAHANGMTSSDLFADSVVLKEIASTPAADYTIGGDLTPTIGTTADTGIIRTFAYVDASKKGDGASGHAIFLPKDKKSIPAEFYIKVNKTHYLLKAKLPSMAFEKGHNYMYTARVKEGSVDLVLNVVSWNHVAQNNPDMGADNGSILIGSWDNIDWSGSMGGNPDEVTAPIQVGSWTGVNLPADFIGGQPGEVSGWGGINQDIAEFGK